MHDATLVKQFIIFRKEVGVQVPARVKETVSRSAAGCDQTNVHNSRDLE